MRSIVLRRRTSLNRFCLPPLSLLALLSLQSCSLFSWVPGMDRLTGEEGMFRDRKAEYLEAETIPRMQIPEGLDSFIIDDLLVIPEIPGSANQAFLDAPRPRPLQGRSDREVVIQRMQDTSWIVVDVSPSQVWPRIRDYWTAKGVDLAVENPTAGIMETAWFVQPGNVLTRERVRVIVETGFQDNSSEVRMLHMSQPQATPAFEVAWPQQSMDPEVEGELVRELAGYLADVADLYTASSVSFLAGSISSEGKASLVPRPNGTEVLRLQSNYDRAWAAVTRALQRSNVLINEQDAGTGVIDVSYLPGTGEDKEEPGFFRRLFSFGDDIPEPTSLRIRVQDAGDGVVEVEVEPVANGPEPEVNEQGETPAVELLRLIRNTIA
jgi:Uncharacterized lipoprotein